MQKLLDKLKVDGQTSAKVAVAVRLRLVRQTSSCAKYAIF